MCKPILHAKSMQLSLLFLPYKCILHGMKINHTAVGARPGGGGVLSTKVVIGMCRKHGLQNQAARYINGSLFFRKCGTWMGVPVLIGTSMGHFLIIEVHRWAIFYHWYINGS